MKRLAVIGHPVAHSRSPAMHTAALADLGLDDEWSYEAIDIRRHRIRLRRDFHRCGRRIGSGRGGRL